VVIKSSIKCKNCKYYNSSAKKGQEFQCVTVSQVKCYVYKEKNLKEKITDIDQIFFFNATKIHVTFKRTIVKGK